MEDLLSETFHFDVDTYADLFDLNVQIDCLGQRTYTGRVYTIDPLTQSFVLFNESNNRVHIILRNDIQQVKILDRIPKKITDPFVVSTCSDSTNSDELISVRQENLRTFLSSKRIPFQEKLEENKSITFLIQNGLVQIHSPYTNQTIMGTNEIVLSRMKFLLKQILN